MSVELDPVELGFKRKLHALALDACRNTKLDRPIPARGVADPPLEEPTLRSGGLQGEQAHTHCLAWALKTTADTYQVKTTAPKQYGARSLPSPQPLMMAGVDTV
jgi:hypothetical protein